MQTDKTTKTKNTKNTDNSVTDALPSSFKKFRRIPEVESFYRFIFENDLRKEGKVIIDKILLKRKLIRMAAKNASKKTSRALRFFKN